MDYTKWKYETAKDSGLSFIDRLKACPREPDPFVYTARLTSAVAIRAALRAYFRFEIEGRERLPRNQSFVMVANHASHLDAVSLLSALPLSSLNQAYPVAARDYFCANDPRLALTAIIANVMLFDRGERSADSLKLCRRILEESGNVLIMFPEGTRSINGRVGLFRRGIGLLLAGTDTPVVPCYLDGAFKALPKGTLLPRPRRVRLAIGERRTYEHVPQNDFGVLHICAELRREVLALAPQRQPQTARSISNESASSPGEAYL
jgi:1-acyl-sn-glycerol-3-phosphate acyltransferase